MPCQLVISYRRFKNTSSSETQLTIHQSTCSNVPQDSKRPHGCQNLKSHAFQNFFFTFTWPCIVTHFLVINPTRCTKFSNLFWKWNSFEQDQDGTAVTSWSCCSKSVYKPVWHIPLPSVQWINPDDGQRNGPKHVEFHFQNKFENLVHLVGFITRKISKYLFTSWYMARTPETFH
jgi:hypothetical protein